MTDVSTIDLSGNLEDWVVSLPTYQQTTILAMLEKTDELDVAIAWLQSSGHEQTAPLGAVRTAAALFYDTLLNELHAFLCIDSSYRLERQSLLKDAHAGKAAIIAAAAEALAPHLGTAAVLIGPPIAITLAIVGRASRAATCEALQKLIEERKASISRPAESDGG